MKKLIAQFLSSSKQVSGIYEENQIGHVPEPAQRYLKYAVAESRRYVSQAYLKHIGEFKPSRKWTPIKGEEYFTIQPPGFVWFGKVRFISAIDTYQQGFGRMQIKLLSTFKLVDAKGEEFNQGELVRWLSETPWFPTALLPSENIRWEAIDANSAKIHLTDHGLTVEGTFFFNEDGKISKFKAKRSGNGKLQDWICHYYDYREVDGFYVPFYVDASWEAESEEYKYAKFKIKSIEYDQAFESTSS